MFKFVQMFHKAFVIILERGYRNVTPFFVTFLIKNTYNYYYQPINMLYYMGYTIILFIGFICNFFCIFAYNNYNQLN